MGEEEGAHDKEEEEGEEEGEEWRTSVMAKKGFFLLLVNYYLRFVGEGIKERNVGAWSAWLEGKIGGKLTELRKRLALD